MAVWHVTLLCAELFSRSSGKKMSLKSAASLALLAVSTLVSLAFLSIIREHFDRPFFFLLLALIACASAAIFFAKKNVMLASLVTLFISDALTAYATFLFVGSSLSGAVAIYAIGIAGQVSAYRFACFLSGTPVRIYRYRASAVSPLSAKERSLLIRCYRLMLISGVATIGVLTLIGMLSPFYFLSYLLLPSIASLADEVRQNPENPQTIKEFLPRNTRILLFIAVIIPTISVLLAIN